MYKWLSFVIEQMSFAIYLGGSKRLWDQLTAPLEQNDPPWHMPASVVYNGKLCRCKYLMYLKMLVMTSGECDLQNEQNFFLDCCRQI